MEHLLEEHYDNHRWVTVHRYLGDQSLQTALSPRLYDLSRGFLDYNNPLPPEKARETAGDAILNYKSHVFTTLEFVTRRYSNWEWVDHSLARFVSKQGPLPQSR